MKFKRKKDQVHEICMSCGGRDLGVHICLGKPKPDREPSAFTREQAARAEALVKARNVLCGPLAGMNRSNADPIDAVNLAMYIVTGEDPWLQHVAKEDIRAAVVEAMDADEAPEMEPDTRTMG